MANGCAMWVLLVCAVACSDPGGDGNVNGGTGGNVETSGSGGAPAPVCGPGTTQLCFGPGACEGAQVCRDNGSGWDTCDCGTISGAAGSAGALPITSAGTAGNGGLDCPPQLRACAGLCVDLASNAEHCGQCGRECETGMVCRGGECGCPVAEETLCEGICANTNTDANNCGACGDVCTGTGEVCIAGVCDCPEELLDCRMSGTAYPGCWDPMTTQAHCGSCMTYCINGVCVDGFCVYS